MLYCPKCKKNQDTIEIHRAATVVTYRCAKCGTYIRIPVVHQTAVLPCPKCKKDQEFMATHHTATRVTAKCTTCSTYVRAHIRRKK